MATDTVPATVPGPPEPTSHTTPATQGAKGFLASMVAAVEPARPTFDLAPTLDPAAPQTAADGALDRSAPGVSSASFRDTTEQATKSGDPAGTRHKRSVWKEMWLAAATRWAKGGGAANKRLDLAKARAQSHQVKEARTVSVNKSGGLPTRNSAGAGAGSDKGSGKSGGNNSGKSPVNGSGNRSNGSGRDGSGGSGGGRGPFSGPGGNSAGGTGKGSTGGGTAGKDTAGAHRGHSAGGSGSGKGSGSAAGPTGKDNKDRSGKTNDSRNSAGKDNGAQPPSGTSGGAGKPGSGGKNGKDGASGKTSNSGGTGPGSSSGSGGTSGTGHKTDLTKKPKNGKGKDTAPDRGHGDGTTRKPGQPPTTGKTPLEQSPLGKSRETGHGDGTKARRVVDHVKAYADGARDGWNDEKHRNAKEHARLDQAHTAHKPHADRPQAVIVTEKEDDGVTTDVKPLTVQNIDANTLTLGTETGNARTTVGRRELRNFKQYERKLEAKETVLQQIADACTQLAKEAEDEAKDCQTLLEQAKSIAGGEKVAAKLAKLADAAHNQAGEAAELAQRAHRAAEMSKVVLTNIQTRYAPLYKAVVDSDETKPAELRFYNDKGTYAPAAA